MAREIHRRVMSKPEIPFSNRSWKVLSSKSGQVSSRYGRRAWSW